MATRVSSQSGILDGANPIEYSAKNPIMLFIVQAAIIIIFCRLLHYPLRYFGQPRVIAEVIGGILLGPSVMMRIPGFKANIFPDDGMPVLNNVANLGLILFLFLTGLEVDLRLFVRNWQVAVSVAAASMILPFGLGYGIAWGLYSEFGGENGTEPIRFAVFGLFIGTALAITAFPVLCRILTELNLLGNRVGVTVLAAGVGNDVVGWILLALCVSLVNNASGLTALYALLCVFGWCFFLVLAVRPVFIALLKRNGSLQNGPSEAMVCVTILLVLTSAWFTGSIGVHPIFGGFLVGLICPHDGGFTIKLTEKIEDFVSAFFLPLYFALSGLSTNLGLLNNGITWAYVIGVIAVAFSGKIIGGTLSARLCQLYWRESFAIGVLMSCKGLVELIVLNIGLQAKILSQRTFTIFVVMALVTTVATTPLTKAIYPPSYQQKAERFRRGEIDWEGCPMDSDDASEQQQQASFSKLRQSQIRHLLVYLRLDSLPGLFTFISLMGGADADGQLETSSPPSAAVADKGSAAPPRNYLYVHGIRFHELTERTSTVMKVTEVDELARRDPVVNTFRTFSQLHDVAASGQVAVVPAASYPETLTAEASETGADFVLIPWSERGLASESQLDSLASSAAAATDRFEDRAYLSFVHDALEKAVCSTGIFIDNGLGGVPSSLVTPLRPRRAMSIISSSHSHREPATLPVANKSHRLFFPFFGGVDDRAALRFVLQLARNKNVSATIAIFSGEEGAEEEGTDDVAASGTKAGAVYDEPSAHDLGVLAMLRASLPSELAGRVVFTEVAIGGRSPVQVLDGVILHHMGGGAKNAGDIVVVGRRHQRFGDTVGAGHETASSSSPVDLRRTIGGVGAHVVCANLKGASSLIIQAGGRDMETNNGV